MTAAPERLAKRISACALARTCVTVPGADSTMSVHMVWIESMTTRRGVSPALSVATMSSIEVGEAGGNAGGIAGGAGKRLEREQAAFARCTAGQGRSRRGRIFLGDGVPFPAGVAFALP